jgi:IclR family KDG regulon transcriptional repressor
MDKTFLKGLRLLETLARSEHGRGVTELACELGLTKSNVHRLLQTLMHRGFVEQELQSANYRCTLKLFDLGSVVADGIEVKQVALPYLTELAKQTRETIHLSVLEGAEVLYLHKIDSPQPVRAYSRIGGRAPAHCVATGKALLAFSPNEQLAVLDGHFSRHTALSITNAGQLQRELAKVREQGFAVNRGEWRESVGGVAAPVFDATCYVNSAIGVSGPITRLTPRVMRDFAPLIIETAQAISRALGYTATNLQRAVAR